MAVCLHWWYCLPILVEVSNEFRLYFTVLAPLTYFVLFLLQGKSRLSPNSTAFWVKADSGTSCCSRRCRPQQDQMYLSVTKTMCARATCTKWIDDRKNLICLQCRWAPLMIKSVPWQKVCIINLRTDVSIVIFCNKYEPNHTVLSFLSFFVGLDCFLSDWLTE